MPLPDSARLGAVDLAVSDLDRAVAFYQDALGLKVHDQEPATARLGTGEGEELLVLREEPAARPQGRHAGLFHVAYLFPTREDLARALVRLAGSRARIDGASDHGVSEAIYLRDPDGHGIELYADRPREAWPEPRPGEKVHMYTVALDLDGLLETVRGEDPQRRATPGLVVGHVHLQIGDISKALAFYDEVVGFDLMTLFPGAAFVAAGGYHHHLGLNTWAGEGIGPQPADAVGLRRWRIVLPAAADVEQVRERAGAAGLDAVEDDGGVVLRDPWDLAVEVRAA